LSLEVTDIITAITAILLIRPYVNQSKGKAQTFKIPEGRNNPDFEKHLEEYKQYYLKNKRVLGDRALGDGSFCLTNKKMVIYYFWGDKMPRQARIKSETGIYHIMTRGINKEKIFKNEIHKNKVIEIIKGIR